MHSGASALRPLGTPLHHCSQMNAYRVHRTALPSIPLMTQTAIHASRQQRTWPVAAVAPLLRHKVGCIGALCPVLKAVHVGSQGLQVLL